MPEEVDRDYIRIRGTIIGTRHKIANVCCIKQDGKVVQRETDEARANARLIASAPELLLVLETLMESEPQVPSRIRDWALSVISKAKGESK